LHFGAKGDWSILHGANGYEEDLRRIACSSGVCNSITSATTPTSASASKKSRRAAGGDCHRHHLQALPLFYLALQGTTPDNPEVRRKRNIVTVFWSSHAVGLMVKQQNELRRLDPRDYAARRSFPFSCRTGCVGTITVSGRPQREDHCLRWRQWLLSWGATSLISRSHPPNWQA
jgi:hypothetical protein